MSFKLKFGGWQCSLVLVLVSSIP